MKDYQVLVELDDKDADAHFHLALLYARNEDWDQAEFHYGRAVELKPRSPWIIQGYGNAKLRAGKLGEAEQLLSEAEEINPRHPATLVDLGRLRERQGQTGDAEEYYRKAIEASPDFSFAYYQLASLLYREGEITEAYDMAKAAVATQPLDARNKSLVEELKKKLDAAATSSAATGAAPTS